MNFEQINALTVETMFHLLASRLLDFSAIPVGEDQYTLDEDDQLSRYDRVTFHTSITKPSLAAFEAELVVLKAEFTATEQARLDEIVRIQDIEDRFDALVDIRLAISEAGFIIPNSAIELRRIIEENDTARLVSLETSDAAAQVKEAAKAVKAARKAMSKGIITICTNCIEIIMEHNLSNGLTDEQLDTQAVTHAAAFTALNGWRPKKFKTYIEAAIPDGTLVTQDMKDELMVFLDSVVA